MLSTVSFLLIIYILGYQKLDCIAFVSLSPPCLRYRHTTVSLHQTLGPSNTKFYKHILAILTVPRTSLDRIANEAILETCMRHVVTTSSTSKTPAHPHGARISVVLRRQDGHLPQLNELRGYVGEIYSMAWDCALGLDSSPPIQNQMNSTHFWNSKAENNGGQILDVIGMLMLTLVVVSATFV